MRRELLDRASIALDEELLEGLIDELVSEYNGRCPIPTKITNRNQLFRSLMNIRMPKPLNPDFLKIQDEYLQRKTACKGVVVAGELLDIETRYGCHGPHSSVISLWQGDITRLKVDGIVNAANNRMLGCFAVGHRCIDNEIHSAAGLELREACNRYMDDRQQIDVEYVEPAGQVMITEAYNLPSRYVLHTVGPIVNGLLTDAHKSLLASCYRSIMKTAADHELRSIAFCCISTGEYHFPNEAAAIIAVDTVDRYLRENPGLFDRIVFNVFKDIDLEIYHKILRQKY